jgi:lysophospholipase L1-like esterase
MTIKSMMILAAVLAVAVFSPSAMAAKSAPINLPVSSAQILDSGTLGPSAGASLEHNTVMDNLGGWTDPHVLVRWTAHAEKPGVYRVDLYYSQPTGNDGASIAVSVGDQSVETTPPATGDWSIYKTVPVGEVQIDKAGDVDVILVARKTPHEYIMNVRSIILTPVRGKKPASDVSGPVLTPLALAGQRVLWLGDSITQDGKYVTDIEYALGKRYPDQKFDVVSIGLASETTSGQTEKRHPFPRPDVHERLKRALDKVKPSVVVACYGMNDGIYHPQSPERFAAFKKGVQSLIDTVRASGARLILLTPPPFDAKVAGNVQKSGAADYSYMDPYENYDDVLAEYAAWEMGLRERGLNVIDLHTPLAEYRKRERGTDPGFKDTGDGIHPDAAGHLAMARVFLNGLGVPVQTNATHAELVADVQKMEADPLYDLVRKQREARSNGWLAYVGYTRGDKVQAASVDAAETETQALQAQIDTLRQPIRIACVGDSITWGSGVDNRNVNSYPAVLGGWLGEGYQVTNFGVSGTTMLKHGDSPYWSQKAFTDAKAFQPNIVVIMLGTNDTKSQNWKYKDEFTADYTDMVRQFADLPSKPKIYLCRPVPVPKTGNYGINDAGVQEEIPMINAIATQTQATEVDVHAALSGHDDLIPDNVHPNAAGAKLIAAAVYHALTGMDAPLSK